MLCLSRPHHRLEGRVIIAIQILGVLIGLLVLLVIANIWSPRKRINHQILSHYRTDDPQLLRTMGSLMGPSILAGNRVTPLQNGDEIFPAMIAAIRQAQKTITLETFIYWSGRIGQDIADALIERARAGVKVHVLLDWIGSRDLDDAALDQMKAAGIWVEKYHPLRWYNLARLNNRTHRKILVVDGRMGFTGGVGIADLWQGRAESPDHWRDSHYQVEGPVVAQMQAAFLDNWHTNSPEVLHSADYFPPLEAVGDAHGQMFRSSPQEGSGSVRLMYMLSIAAAHKSLRIAVAYFVPDGLAVRMLIEAVKRGVKVEIIVPGPHIDTAITRRASRATWGRLLKAGIAIYEYQPTMYHCKYMIVDDVWVSVGSTNFDNRSFRLNHEANLNIYNAAFAESQALVFEADKSHSKRMTLKAWKRRPWTEKIVEGLASLIRSQL